MSRAAFRGLLSGAAIMLAAATISVSTFSSPPAHAAEVRYVVNDEVITSYDIDRRAALLKLMGRSGNLRNIANQEMIDQTLRLQEVARARVGANEQMVNEAYANFAKSNQMTTAQLDQALTQASVTRDHFKGFIRTQIGWSRLLQSRARSSQTLSEQDVVARILEQGGKKPSATEYTLQQVIFVVPAAERGKIMGRRKQEAQAMRNQFGGCENTINQAQGKIDVTIRELGRILEPQLPGDWKDQVVKTKAGAATAIRETERGVEFIGVCSTREISDDYVARLVFQNEQKVDTSGEKLSNELTEELRKKARIIQR